jgi:glycosyltransferase involved in cell wall biosynthesis
MLARELVSLGHSVTFLTSLPSNKFFFPYKKEIREGVCIYAFADIVPNFMRRTGFGFLGLLSKLIFILFHKFDIYHSDAGHRPSGGVSILIKKVFSSNIVYVCEWWDYFGIGGQFDDKQGFRKYTHGYYDVLLEIREKRWANGVICLSHAMKERAIKENISEAKLCVVNGGCDIRKIKYSNTKAFRVKYGINSSDIVFGFIGMTNGELNDVKPFIDALNELNIESRKYSNCILLTTGKILSEVILNSLNLKFRIIQIGWIDYIYFSEVLSCIDAFLLLQQQNLANKTRWPNKLGDYIAAGRKTIINFHGDTRLIAEKYNELFIQVSFNKESIKKKLIEVIASGEIFADRERIRQIAEEELSWNMKSKQLVEFYSKLIDNK